MVCRPGPTAGGKGPSKVVQSGPTRRHPSVPVFTDTVATTRTGKRKGPCGWTPARKGMLTEYDHCAAEVSTRSSVLEWTTPA